MELIRTIMCRIWLKRQLKYQNRAKFKTKIDEEYKEFKALVLNESKEAIFQQALKISFYEAVHKYVLGDDVELSDTILDGAKNVDCPISLMYNYAVTEDYEANLTLEDIQYLLEDVFYLFRKELMAS